MQLNYVNNMKARISLPIILLVILIGISTLLGIKIAINVTEEKLICDIAIFSCCALSSFLLTLILDEIIHKRSTAIILSLVITICTIGFTYMSVVLPVFGEIALLAIAIWLVTLITFNKDK